VSVCGGGEEALLMGESHLENIYRERRSDQINGSL